jgi:probable F420-dependent oxidoreductase
MAAVAARTERLELMTGILVLPLRHPLLVAKSTATVDAISGGRLALGIGVGWLQEEFAALDLDYRRRGRMTNESIEVLRQLWTGEPTAHEGEAWSFPEVTVRPPAAHRIPIYVGGKSDGALRRAGRLGDGFMPPVGSEEETRELIATVARIRAEAGRAEAPFEVIAPATVSAGVDDFRRLAEIGIGTVRVDPFALYVQKYGGLAIEQRREALERYAAEVIAPLRAAGL